MPASFFLAIVAVLLFAAVGLLAFSYWRAAALLRPIRRAPDRHPRDVGLDVEDVRIPGPRGQLAAWYLRGTNGCTVIFCHGINDNRAQWISQVADLHRRGGYGAILFDFSGHGDSEGSMVTYGVREALDVAAVLDYLRQRGDVDMTRVGILGYSLGAITATLAAATLPELRCLVIESGFADLQHDIGMLFRRYTGLPAFPFANLIVFWGQILSNVRLSEIRPARVIGSISPRACFIISDLADEIANEPYDGEHLYAAAREPKRLWQLPGVSHVRAYEAAPAEWVERVGGFLDEYLAGKSALKPTPIHEAEAM